MYDIHLNGGRGELSRIKDLKLGTTIKTASKLVTVINTKVVKTKASFLISRIMKT